MRDRIDIQKVMLEMGEAKLVNLDVSLRELASSSAVGLVNAAAQLDPWDLICYTWVIYIHRGIELEQVVTDMARLQAAALAKGETVGG